MSDELPKSQFLIYQSQYGRIRLEVRFEGETVWLSQQFMAELFETTQQNISLHFQNIYEVGELLVRSEGAPGCAAKPGLLQSEQGTWVNSD